MGIHLGFFGPYFFLRTYLCITKLFDLLSKHLHHALHTSIVKNVNRAVGLLISITLLNCPKKNMVEVCPNENVTFWLFNQNLSKPYQLNEVNLSTLAHAPFNEGYPIKILIHGYTGHKDHDPNPQIRPHYVNLGYNIISVDYEPVSRKPCYFQAVDNSGTVGYCLGNFIDLLLKHNKKVNVQMIHVITFSLGAHVGASAGVFLRSKRNISLERLTVLDAAAPMFYIEKNFVSEKCAKFIDAIHTNAGVYGKTARVGHVDFYVNYLLFQRGCSIFDVSCNHLRAPLYFGESIKSKVGFWGYPLTDSQHIEIMGEFTPTSASGMYYLSTNSESPYATGDNFPAALRSMKGFILNLLQLRNKRQRRSGYMYQLYLGIEKVIDYFDQT